MEDFKSRATDPHQYDKPELDWSSWGEKDHPSRKFFQKYLIENIEDIKGKRILDIGSGTGQLFSILYELGAKKVIGVEPSNRNIKISNDKYPNVLVYQNTFENFITDEKFDVAISVMAFEHIFDTKQAFLKVFELLEQEGHFYLIIGNKDVKSVTQAPHEGILTPVESQSLGNGIVATKTDYSGTIIYDIFRPLKNVISDAGESGLEMVKKVDLESKGVVSCYLLIFKRK